MAQLDMFDMLYEDYKFPTDRPVRLFEAFAGIGCQKQGFDRAGIEAEVVGISEIDKHALTAYEAIHGHAPNLGSITDITGDMMPDNIDVFTYSFPCTDLSKAGQRKGMSCSTQSGLVYEVMRLLEEMQSLDKLPQVLIMENVVDLIQARFVDQFNEDIQIPLEKMGYTNYVFTMNAKDYGVPQNRDRVFMVSILGKYNYTKPRPFPLKKKLKDCLEDEVDESYYLSDKQIKQITNWKSYQNPIEDAKYEDSDYVQTITAKSNTSMNASMLLLKEKTKRGYREAFEGDGVYINRPHQKRGVVQDGMTPTIKANCSDIGVVVPDDRPVIVKGKSDKETLCNTLIANDLVEEGDMIRHSYTKNRMNDSTRKENENGISATLTTRPDTLGVVVNDDKDKPKCLNSKVDGKQPSLQDRVYDSNYVSTAVTTSYHPNYTDKNLRIRKLTPRETGRLMGMSEDAIDRQLAVVSNSQAYKQHGNGIVVDVFAHIVAQMKGD